MPKSGSIQSIFETDSISFILPIIEQRSHGRMIALFDLDNTLIRSGTYLSSPEFGFTRYKHLVTDNTNLEDAFVMMVNDFVYVAHYDQSVLVEPTAPKLLRELKAKGVICLGLTSRTMFLAQRTIDVLHELDIEFSQILPERRLFSESNHSVIYQQGVIFCSLFVAKSRGLGLVLNAAAQTPDTILMVDDEARYLTDVGNFCVEQGFNFYGARLNACDQIAQSMDYAKIEAEFCKFKAQHKTIICS